MIEQRLLLQLQCAQTSKGDWWLYGECADGVVRAFATTPDEGTARVLIAAVNQAPLVGELVQERAEWMAAANCHLDGLNRMQGLRDSAVRERNDARALVEEMVGKLLRYGHHDIHCHRTNHPHMHRGVDCDDPHPCDCGWVEVHSALLLRVREAQGKGA